MTLNEARDYLVSKYPGRAICVTGECWHHPHINSEDTNTTSLVATLFTVGATTIDKRFEASNLTSLLAMVKRAMEGPADSDTPIRVTPEPVTVGGTNGD